MAKMKNYEVVWKSPRTGKLGSVDFRALNVNNARKRLIRSKKLEGPYIAGHSCELHDYIGVIGKLKYDPDMGYLWEEKHGSVKTVYLVSKKTGGILWGI